MITLHDAEVASHADRVLKAIQGIPALKHVPIFERSHRETDVVLDACLKKELSGLDEALQKRIRSELFGLGPLEALEGDEDLTEILVLAPETLWIERGGRLEPAADRFLNALTYRHVLQRLAREARTTTDHAMPFADGRWKQFRVHVVSEPIVNGYGQLSLRRIRSSPWTLTHLAERGWADDHGLDCLKKLVHEKNNVLFIGGTGSGKTSALSACLREIESRERVLILEDTDELPLPNSVSTKLLSKKSRSETDTEYDLGDLLKQALRMRPDRLVMGEVRGPEAKDLLMAFATGHRGCWGTLHADSPREALLRLEMLVQMGAPQWSTHTVRALIHAAVDAVAVVGKDENGTRRLESIHRVASLEEMGFCFNSLYARKSMKLPRG